MTIEIGDTSFAALIQELRKQVNLLKERCALAEAKAEELTEVNQLQQSRINELENSNEELTNKYQGLRAGTAQGASEEDLRKLQDRYLAMIREIDSCLSKLNG